MPSISRPLGTGVADLRTSDFSVLGVTVTVGTELVSVGAGEMGAAVNFDKATFCFSAKFSAGFSVDGRRLAGASAFSVGAGETGSLDATGASFGVSTGCEETSWILSLRTTFDGRGASMESMVAVSAFAAFATAASCALAASKAVYHDRLRVMVLSPTRNCLVLSGG